MKFTVEIEDFYLEEGQLSAELQHAVKQDVIRQIQASIKTQVDTAIVAEVKAQVTAALSTLIQSYVQQVITTGTVPSFKDRNVQVTLNDYIIEMFNYSASRSEMSGPVNKKIEEVAKAAAKELTARYDMLFATQVVLKMKDAGFLNEQAARVLLDKQP